MTSDEDEKFNRVVDKLREAIKDEMRTSYSEIVIHEYSHPENVGRMTNSDGFARITGVCCDTMEIFLKIDDERLIDSQLMTDGCGATIACGSMVTKMSKGKTIDDALSISSEDLVEILEGLPEENLHCAALATDTLHRAIVNHISRVKEGSS